MKLIAWTYWHYLPGTAKCSKRPVTKGGVYYGKVKHTSRYDGPQLAVVKFNTNKRTSRVPFSELTFI